MNLIPSLNADNIFTLTSTIPSDAIRELVTRIVNNSNSIPQHSVDSLTAAVLKREAAQSTGVGHGFAFPHARIDEWPHQLEIAIGISKPGLNFNSVDTEPVHLVCVMLSSRDEPYLILKKMSSVIHALKPLELATGDYNKSRILSLLDSHDKSKETIIYAGDVMRPVDCTVTMDTSIEDVAHLMHTRRQDVIPIVDDAQKFCGEVSCYDIFQFGMPAYFFRLPTISFVRHIDPFEQYFRIRGDMRVSNLTLCPAKPLSRHHTLLEVIFEMTINKRGRLFVTNGHDLVNMMGDNLFGTCMAIMWGSAVFSAILDNIPFVIAMVPLVKTVIAHFAALHGGADAAFIDTQIAQPIWWSLALGACLGGNGTLIGASANVVMARIAERNNCPVSFGRFFKWGFAFTIQALLISTAFIWIRFFNAALGV